MVVGYEAAPEIALLKGQQIKFCDNSEIIRAAFQRSEQVRVRFIVCTDDLSAGKNDLGYVNTVGSPCIDSHSRTRQI